MKPTYQSSTKKPKLSTKISTTLKDDDDDEDDHVPISQRTKNRKSSVKKPAKSSCLHKTNEDSKKAVKNGKKWTTLVHNGVIFPPSYKPHGIKMLYNNRPVTLTPEQEEVATMFSVMKDTEYVNDSQFRKNFFSDWKKLLGKKHEIQNLDDCNFSPIHQWHLAEKEKMKQISSKEKKALKAEKDKLEEKYQWAFVDGVKEKVGNCRVEPPGLFRGRGEHKKMGKLKKRIRPSDVVINIGKDAPVPECSIPGETWKEVTHSDTVEWLASWPDPINERKCKYVHLAANSSLKGQSDKHKDEKARLLKKHIKDIRASYTKDFASKDHAKKQIAVATYLIDKLALRAGNEKDDDEAETVGCCTLKVEHVEVVPPRTLKLDFLGKDSVRYQNEVQVKPAVFRAVKDFRKGKMGSEDLFDRLDTGKLNAHLKQLMEGLTAKVFRTYNASITLDNMLAEETEQGGDVAEKVAVYNRANKEVAVICNHQRAVSKTHAKQMAQLDEKIDGLRAEMEELENEAGKGKIAVEKKIAQTNAKIEKLERDRLTKEDLKTVALGTSKINYMDPRITVAWCKRHQVPIEKIFSTFLLAKFCWAMDVDPSFRF